MEQKAGRQPHFIIFLKCLTYRGCMKEGEGKLVKVGFEGLLVEQERGSRRSV